MQTSLIFFTFPFSFLTFFIFTDLFRFTFQFLFLLLNYIMKTNINIKKRKQKKQKQNRQSRPSCFVGRSIWRIKVSIRRSAAFLTMLAQVNFLILPPLIALNHKLYFFSTYLLIILFKPWKSH